MLPCTSKNDLTDRAQSQVPTLTTEQRKDLLNSLASPEFEECHTAITDAYGSCKWLLGSPEYARWSDTSTETTEDDPIFWIKGKTGSGKSTIIKSILAHYRTRTSKGLVVSFFFHNQGSDLQKTAKGMYQSLLLQVLQQTDMIPFQVNSLGQLTRNSTWQTSTLKRLLEFMVPRLGRPVLCFVDALDQCPSADVQDITDFVARLAHLCRQPMGEDGTSPRQIHGRKPDRIPGKQTVFRWCFSSRHDPSIPTQKRQALCLEEQAGHNRNIRRYVEHELQIGPYNITRDIQKALQQKASGVFLWAVLAIKILQKDFACAQKHSLRQRLKQMPKDFSDLYLHLLVDGTKKDSRDRQLLCLQRVLFAQKPPTPIELYLTTLPIINPNAARTTLRSPKTSLQRSWRESLYCTHPTGSWRSHRRTRQLSDSSMNRYENFCLVTEPLTGYGESVEMCS